MTEPKVTIPASEPRASRRLSPNVTALGFVGMLTAISSAMIYGLLPVFMVGVLGISVASVGIIEGMAESAASLVKIVSGAVSDRIGRRKVNQRVGAYDEPKFYSARLVRRKAAHQRTCAANVGFALIFAR